MYAYVHFCACLALCAYLCASAHIYVCSSMLPVCVFMCACLNVSARVPESVCMSLCINACTHIHFSVHTVLVGWGSWLELHVALQSPVHAAFGCPLLIAEASLLQTFLWGLGWVCRPQSRGVSPDSIVLSSQSPTLLKPRVLSPFRPLPVGSSVLSSAAAALCE